MVRRFVTLDGEVTAEEEWNILPKDRCFYCNQYLVAANEICPTGFDGSHEFVTLIES